MRFSKIIPLCRNDMLIHGAADWGTKRTSPEATDDALLLRRMQCIFSCSDDVDRMLAVLRKADVLMGAVDADKVPLATSESCKLAWSDTRRLV